MRATDQILEFLDGPKRYSIEDRLGDMRGRDMTLDQLDHYTANRRARENHKDEESVFEELCRLRMMQDEETTDAFARIAKSMDKSRAQKLAAEAPDNGIAERTIARIAHGMLQDGWPESQVVYALGTLGTTMGESQAA